MALQIRTKPIYPDNLILRSRLALGCRVMGRTEIKAVMYKSHFAVPKLSSHGIYIPNGCKHFEILLQLFYGNKANSNKTLRKSKKRFVKTAF